FLLAKALRPTPHASPGYVVMKPMNSQHESPQMATHCSRRSFLLEVAWSAQSAVPFFAVARPPLFPNAHKPDQSDRANQRFGVADGVLSEASLIQHETHRTFPGRSPTKTRCRVVENPAWRQPSNRGAP